MFLLLLAAFLTSSKSEIPPDSWACSNDVEVWCADDSCEARPKAEITPMAIAARRSGEFSVCAYTGCWEGRARVSDTAGRLLWVADEVAFSSQPEGGFTADVSLLIIEQDGTGFVRVGGIASPLLCLRQPVDQTAGE